MSKESKEQPDGEKCEGCTCTPGKNKADSLPRRLFNVAAQVTYALTSKREILGPPEDQLITYFSTGKITSSIKKYFDTKKNNPMCNLGNTQRAIFVCRDLIAEASEPVKEEKKRLLIELVGVDLYNWAIVELRGFGSDVSMFS